MREDFWRSEQPISSRQARYAKNQTIVARLKATLVREKALLGEKDELLRRQELLAKEFEHRFVNGLQLIVSLLALQSRAAATVEVAAQLSSASDRVAAIGRVNRRLHLLDQDKTVELKRYLQDLCDDLADMFFQKDGNRAIVVTGQEIRLSTALGVPLGFIAAELVTNSVKYATGRITIEIDASPIAYSLSVMDDGPGLPADFDPTKSRGIGMKIVQALAKQIGGALQYANRGCGACVTVTFAPQIDPSLSLIPAPFPLVHRKLKTQTACVQG